MPVQFVLDTPMCTDTARIIGRPFSSFNDASDVDFSVNFDADAINSEKIDWADTFFDFLHGLEAIIGRRIDLVCDDAVSNPVFRNELDRTKHLIYG